jgi:hypothetical protein
MAAKKRKVRKVRKLGRPRKTVGYIARKYGVTESFVRQLSKDLIGGKKTAEKVLRGW